MTGERTKPSHRLARTALVPNHVARGRVTDHDWLFESYACGACDASYEAAVRSVPMGRELAQDGALLVAAGALWATLRVLGRR